MTKYHSLHTQQIELARQLKDVRSQLSVLAAQQTTLKKQRASAGKEMLSSLQTQIETNKKTLTALETTRDTLKSQLRAYLPVEVLEARFKHVDAHLTSKRQAYNELAAQQVALRQKLSKPHSRFDKVAAGMQAEKQRNTITLRQFNQRVLRWKQRYAELHETLYKAQQSK